MCTYDYALSFASGQCAWAVDVTSFLCGVDLWIPQAPKRRLKLEKLCKQLVQHAHEHHHKHKMVRTYSHEDVNAILARKARKTGKVVIEDGVARLPVA
jgi:hypothetical protein